MLQFKTREAFQTGHYTEYTTTIPKGETIETLEILTESVVIVPSVSVSSVAGAGPQYQELLGKIIEQAAAPGGSITGQVLWVNADDTANIRLGIRLTDPSRPLLDEEATTLDGNAIAPSAIRNMVERVGGDGVLDRVYAYQHEFDLPAVAETHEFYVDVRNTKKILLAHAGSSGLIRLSHVASGLVVSPWLRPGQQFVLECANRHYWKLILEETEVDTPVSIGVVSHTMIASDVAARTLSAPKESDAEKSRAVPEEPQKKAEAVSRAVPVPPQIKQSTSTEEAATPPATLVKKTSRRKKRQK